MCHMRQTREGGSPIKPPLKHILNILHIGCKKVVKFVTEICTSCCEIRQVIKYVR